MGVVGSSDADGIAFEVRAFFPGNNGLAEDPVTGSLNAALAQWLIGAGLAPAQYVASQGTCLGRAGRDACVQQRATPSGWAAQRDLHGGRGASVNETTTAQGPCVECLVVFAADLAGGVDWCQRTLGITPRRVASTR